MYFKNLTIYKIGVTNNIQKRLKTFGYKPEVILILNFKTGKEAKELESIWLKNILPYKINTGLLRSGNTETFEF